MARKWRPTYLQPVIDGLKGKGLFLLTGSHHFQMMERVTQSLAGRTALLTVLPFAYPELSRMAPDADIDRLLYTGGYPRIYHDRINPTDFHAAYLGTYVGRDIRQMNALADPSQFEKLLALLAGRVGSIPNYASLSNDIGVSAPTVKQWISLLQAAYIVFLMPPYFANIGKRLLKSPKIYFYDTGLACQGSPNPVSGSPERHSSLPQGA